MRNISVLHQFMNFDLVLDHVNLVHLSYNFLSPYTCTFSPGILHFSRFFQSQFVAHFYLPSHEFHLLVCLYIFVLYSSMSSFTLHVAHRPSMFFFHFMKIGVKIAKAWVGVRFEIVFLT